MKADNLRLIRSDLFQIEKDAFWERNDAKIFGSIYNGLNIFDVSKATIHTATIHTATIHTTIEAAQKLAPVVSAADRRGKVPVYQRLH